MTERDVIINAVRELGPMVAELITCSHCGRTTLHVHPFCESVACQFCGKRDASVVPVYNTEPFGDE